MAQLTDTVSSGDPKKKGQISFFIREYSILTKKQYLCQLYTQGNVVDLFHEGVITLNR